MALINLLRNLRITVQPQLLSLPAVNNIISVRNKSKNEDPTHWLDYNNVVFPPQKPGEEPKPAYVCHQKTNIKYSRKKMWYIASMIRGMPVDEAIRQMKFLGRKGSHYVRETLEEAKVLAVKEHNVEFPTNLWVAESFATKGVVFKGLRRHARGRPGEIRYGYIHYFVRLEEGKPPKDYYGKDVTPSQQLEKWLQMMRERRIVSSL